VLGTKLADEEDNSAPPTGTPPGGQPPGVAASQGAPGVTPSPTGDSSGVLPPQGAGVPMRVNALGDHAVGMDMMRAIMKALPEAIKKLGNTKEGAAAAKMYALGQPFNISGAGHADQVDPMRQIAQAIQARRMQNKVPPQTAPPGQAGPPMPNRGPVPMSAGAPA